MVDVSQQCIEANSPEILLSVFARRSSRLIREIPRPLPPKFNLIYFVGGRVRIDKYCTRLNTWTEAHCYDLKVGNFAAVHRNGKLIFMGGEDAQLKGLNTVSARRPVFYLKNGEI